MSLKIIDRPHPSEYDEFYETYVGVVPEGDVLETLVRQSRVTTELFEASPRLDPAARYAADKWSAQEVLGHVIDTERVFSFRALAFARGDGQPLPGMDQEVWSKGSNVLQLPIEDVLGEYRSVRAATLALLRSFDEEILARRGTASGSSVSVRALVFILAGHERHHQRILRERYADL